MLIPTDLGTNLYNAEKAFNNKDINQLGNIETARQQFWISVATEIINYFKANANCHIPGTGLIAPGGGGPVTGNSVTGTIV